MKIYDMIDLSGRIMENVIDKLVVKIENELYYLKLFMSF